MALGMSVCRLVDWNNIFCTDIHGFQTISMCPIFLCMIKYLYDISVSTYYCFCGKAWAGYETHHSLCIQNHSHPNTNTTAWSVALHFKPLRTICTPLTSVLEVSGTACQFLLITCIVSFEINLSFHSICTVSHYMHTVSQWQTEGEGKNKKGTSCMTGDTSTQNVS